MTRIALIIQYNGSDYRGWQSQKDCTNTIQTQLEHAISRVANEAIKVYAAGRTDAGVHANIQVAHFDTTVVRPIKAWILGTNIYLPNDISILMAYQVDDLFHARFMAISRSYDYFIYNASARAALLHKRVAPENQPLDEIAMHAAAQCLVGTQDFSAFRGPHCQAASPIKHVKHVNVVRQDNFVHISITANSFLHHMVRNIAGSLIAIGLKKYPVSWVNTILDSRDRTQAGKTAVASGLYLSKITYPEQYSNINSFISNKQPLLLN